MYKKYKDDLFECIITTNREHAKKIFEDSIGRYGYEKTLINVLEPALKKMGNCWEKGDYKGQQISLAHGYMAGKIAEDFFVGMAEFKDISIQSQTKGVIILGNAEDDHHSLGRKMVKTFLKADNWEVVDLGNDVLPKEFLDAAIENSAKIIGVSAMMYSTAMNIKKVRDEINERGYDGKIKLAVGGAIFKLRPELSNEIGADGMSDNAIDASRLMEKLIGEVN